MLPLLQSLLLAAVGAFAGAFAKKLADRWQPDKPKEAEKPKRRPWVV